MLSSVNSRHYDLGGSALPLPPAGRTDAAGATTALDVSQAENLSFLERLDSFLDAALQEAEEEEEEQRTEPESTIATSNGGDDRNSGGAGVAGVQPLVRRCRLASG